MNVGISVVIISNGVTRFNMAMKFDNLFYYFHKKCFPQH